MSIGSFVDNEKFLYVHDSEHLYLMQSGLIFISSTPIGQSLASTPYDVRCFAPKFYQGKICTTQCNAIVSKIGPYCSEHSILYQNLEVRPSDINPNMRGLFAKSSLLNVHDIRHCRANSIDVPPLRFLNDSEQDDITSRRKPLFLAGDIVGYFGGVYYRKPDGFQETGSMDPTHPSSYVLSYVCNEKEVIVDGFIESSGTARFANSIVIKNDRKIGEKHLNAKMALVNMNKTVFILCKDKVSALPCLIANRDIYDGEEIITDYGKDYWTSEMLQQLPIEMQDYLSGKTQEEPVFFQKK